MDGGEDGRWRGARPEGAKYSRKLRLKGLQMDMIVGGKRWTEAVDEACFRVSLKHASLWSEIFKKIGVEGDADGHYTGGKGGSCGWTEAVYKACFRVSLKHASLWDEIFKKIGVEGDADGDDPGEKGGSRGWTEAVDEACFRVSLKHASLWDEIFRKIEAEGVADGHDSGGKRPWTKHVSGLVSNMLRCGLKYSRKLALKGMQMGIYWGKRG